MDSKAKTISRLGADGFSLIELLMVLMIVAVVAVIAAPRYASSSQLHRVQAASRQVVSDINRAQTTAHSGSSEQRVSFDAANRHVILPDLPTADGSTYVTRLDRQPFQAEIVSVELDDGGSVIRFDGYGQPSTGGRVVLQAGQITQTVRIHPVSGQASVE